MLRTRSCLFSFVAAALVTSTGGCGGHNGFDDHNAGNSGDVPSAAASSSESSANGPPTGGVISSSQCGPLAGEPQLACSHGSIVPVCESVEGVYSWVFTCPDDVPDASLVTTLCGGQAAPAVPPSTCGGTSSLNCIYVNGQPIWALTCSPIDVGPVGSGDSGPTGGQTDGSLPPGCSSSGSSTGARCAEAACGAKPVPVPETCPSGQSWAGVVGPCAPNASGSCSWVVYGCVQPG